MTSRGGVPLWDDRPTGGAVVAPFPVTDIVTGESFLVTLPALWGDELEEN